MKEGERMDRAQLEAVIYEVFDSLERNNFEALGMPEAAMWERPLIGVARGDDSYFDFLKEHIGPFHWSPKEVFELKYAQKNDKTLCGVRPEKLRVVSMVFAQTASTKAEQAKATICPAKNWLVSRGEWEPLMQEFSGKLVKKIEENGVRAVSIDLQPEFSRMDSQNQGIASKWSHRHAAHAAGLGTFGLSDGLITEKGKAIRLTTCVLEADIEVTKRPYQSHNEWCLYYQDGSCGACMGRCPVHAITDKGHDKEICSDYEDTVIRNYWPKDLERGNYIFGCGLCQVSVPCQNRRP